MTLVSLRYLVTFPELLLGNCLVNSLQIINHEYWLWGGHGKAQILNLKRMRLMKFINQKIRIQRLKGNLNQNLWYASDNEQSCLARQDCQFGIPIKKVPLSLGSLGKKSPSVFHFCSVNEERG